MRKISGVLADIKRERASLDAMEKFVIEHEKFFNSRAELETLSASAALTPVVLYLYAGSAPIEVAKHLGLSKVTRNESSFHWGASLEKFDITFINAVSTKPETIDLTVEIE